MPTRGVELMQPRFFPKANDRLDNFYGKNLSQTDTHMPLLPEDEDKKPVEVEEDRVE